MFSRKPVQQGIVIAVLERVARSTTALFTSTLLAFVVAAPMVHAESAGAAATDAMTVYKTPSCGCCSDWADHMQSAGFAVTVVERDDLDALKQQLGVPAQLRSCHTAVIGDYVIEGHVPASDVQKLLSSRSTLMGLAVPGMPLGSPGMESNLPPARYQVIGFDGEEMTVYSNQEGTALAE